MKRILLIVIASLFLIGCDQKHISPSAVLEFNRFNPIKIYYQGYNEKYNAVCPEFKAKTEFVAQSPTGVLVHGVVCANNETGVYKIIVDE